MPYEIFTDSSCNLPNDKINEYDVRVLPLTLIIEGEAISSAEKNNEEGYKGIYRLLREKKNISTSCINTATFVEAFEKSVKEGNDILYIGFSSALSETFNCGKTALEELKRKYPERKLVAIDSLCASLGEGLYVSYAAKLRLAGKSLEEVESWLENNKMRLCHYFTVDDLYWLFKGGRVSKASFIIANMAKIKPLMRTSEEGKLVPVRNVIGRKKALFEVADSIVERIKDQNPEEQEVFIGHGDCIEDAKLVADRISSKVKVKSFLFHYIDPVIGAHSGPGTIAAFCLGDHR